MSFLDDNKDVVFEFTLGKAKIASAHNRAGSRHLGFARILHDNAHRSIARAKVPSEENWGWFWPETEEIPEKSP